VFERLIGKGPYFACLTALDDVIASRGGNLLVVDGKVIGAIGMSGGSGSQDDAVSLAGQAALKQDILGAIPLALSFGNGSEIRRPFGIARRFTPRPCSIFIWSGSATCRCGRDNG
jgi:hypothetical protein